MQEERQAMRTVRGQPRLPHLQRTICTHEATQEVAESAGRNAGDPQSDSGEEVKTLPLNQIVCADCLEVMKTFPDQSIDMILTDPPYNISSSFKVSRGKTGKYRGKDLTYDYGEWDHSSILPANWIPPTIRLLKGNGVFVSLYGNLKIQEVIEILQESG